MKEVIIEKMHMLDTTNELILEKSERDNLLEMKRRFEGFVQLKKIPDGCCKIKDLYDQITLCFGMKSDLRDDLSQHYSLTYHASGFCVFEVEFKTPRLLSLSGENVKYDEIACEFSSEDVVITHSDLSKCSDSVTWNAVTRLKESNLDASIISGAFEKLHSAASEFTRVIELEFWNAFNKTRVSTFEEDPDDFLSGFYEDYEVFEEDTFLGPRAHVSVYTELSTGEIVVEKYGDNVVVESVEHIEFNDKPKKHTYIFEQSAASRFIIKEQLFIDSEEKNLVVGKISRASDNTLCCWITDRFCGNYGEEKVIIVSYDSDAIRAFLSPNMLIATVEKTEENASPEGGICKYIVHTEQFFTGYMRLITALPYLNVRPVIEYDQNDLFDLEDTLCLPDVFV